MAKVKKDPLKKLFVSELGEPFYLNVAKFNYDNKWFPLWYEKWAGSHKRAEAVKLRNEAQKWLQKNGSEHWTKKNFKTVKITLFKEN